MRLFGCSTSIGHYMATILAILPVLYYVHKTNKHLYFPFLRFLLIFSFSHFRLQRHHRRGGGLVTEGLIPVESQTKIPPKYRLIEINRLKRQRTHQAVIGGEGRTGVLPVLLNSCSFRRVETDATAAAVAAAV